MKDESKGKYKKSAVVYLNVEVVYCIQLERLKKTTGTCRQVKRCPHRDLKQVPP
jgi:hypothetical protein